METQNINHNKPNNGKVMAGIIIVIIGGLLLINQFDMFFIPRWLFSWPMWIIAYGLYMGGKYNFRKPVWVWMIIIGTAFLFTENIHNSERLVWPLAIIGAGTWMIMRHNNKLRDAQYHDSNYKEI
jgi:predicted membrane protein